MRVLDNGDPIPFVEGEILTLTIPRDFVLFDEEPLDEDIRFFVKVGLIE